MQHLQCPWHCTNCRRLQILKKKPLDYFSAFGMENKLGELVSDPQHNHNQLAQLHNWIVEKNRLGETNLQVKNKSMFITQCL